MKLATAFVDAVRRHLERIAGRYIAGATQMMVEQRDIGLVKYGVALEDAKLAPQELLRHAMQEMADGSVYLQALAESIENMEAKCYRAGQYRVIEALLILGDSTRGQSHEFRILALEEFLSKWNAALPNIRTLYAQPSQFDEWERTGSNLLTLNRTKTFPFTKPVVVNHD